MAAFLTDPWTSDIGRSAMLEVILLGAFCGAFAYWVVSERLAYATESLAHGLLPGLVIAALAGAPLLLGAAGGAIVAAALIGLAARDERVGPETGTAVAVTGLLGLGALLALSPDAPPRLAELLFGDPLGVSSGDLVAAALLAVLGGAALVVLHRPLCALAFDAAGSAALGVKPGLLQAALLGLLAAAVTIAVQGLGNLLVLATLVAPAVAAGRHASTPARAMLLGGAGAALAGMAGIYVSFEAGAAAGAGVALMLCLLALVGGAVPPARRNRPRSSRSTPAAAASAPR
jgi:ABC-type Mn2+/Zn2+ transport system permease subunit